MNENTVSTGAVVAAALWTWVVVLILGAWVTWALGGPAGMWILLGTTACASSAAAATAHIRIYVVRLSGLIRLANGVDAGRAPGLRSILHD